MPIITGNTSSNTTITSSFIKPPVYANSSVLPSDNSVANGALAYVQSDDGLYYKGNYGWRTISVKLGSINRPAASAAAIIQAGDSLGDGIYYISSTSGTVATYCDMTNGGYMLVAKLDSTQNDEWMYGGSYWSTSTPVNESACQNLNDGTDSVNRLYYEYVLTTGFRICLGSISNVLLESKSGSTAKSFFTGGYSSSQNGRSQFLSWFQTGTGQSSSVFDNQLNCNSAGFNLTTISGAGLRWGITMNNENDCSTNDSAVGMGTYTNNTATLSSGSRNVNAGGHRWSPDVRYGALGLIFVK